MVPDTGKFDVDVVADAMDALFDKMGDGILVTHSAGGGPVGLRLCAILM